MPFFGHEALFCLAPEVKLPPKSSHCTIKESPTRSLRKLITILGYVIGARVLARSEEFEPKGKASKDIAKLYASLHDLL
jgi:hypothetical protein